MTTALAEKPPVEAPKLQTFNASHRCDACGSQAYASATINGSELLFCGHHFTRHERKIVLAAQTVVDERSFLVGKISNVGEGFV